MSSPRAATSVATSSSADSVAHPGHHAVALVLGHAAVQRLGAVTAGGERLAERVDLFAGAAEDHRRGGRLDVQDAPERGRLVLARDEVGDLPHVGGAGLALVAVDAHLDRVGEVALHEAVDALGQRGREQHGLPLARAPAAMIASMSSAKPMSSISSASSSTTVRSSPKSTVAAAEVVDRPARRGDDDVDAALQRADLPADRLAAVDGEHPRAELAAVAVRGLGDLDRELAGRHQHQRLRARRAPRAVSRRCSSGSANAAVLPVPVAAWPTTSRPSSSAGIASRWIGVGSS